MHLTTFCGSLAGLLCAALLSGCQNVRTDPSACTFSHAGMCAGHWREVGPGYRLSYIDIGNSGLVADPRQLEAAVSAIEDTSKTAPTLSVIFVHGWFHSDATSDRDVNRARAMLQFFRSQQPSWKIEGIYVGWHAYTWLPEPLSFLTFEVKKRAAERVAHLGLTETILRVEAATRRNPRNKLLIVGHSFGGLAVLEATSPIFLSRLIEARGDLESGHSHPVQGVGDLVVLLNPAVEASQIIPLLEESNEATAATIRSGQGNRLTGIFAENDRPLLLSLTSKTDDAVGKAFPIGTFLDRHGQQDIMIARPQRADPSLLRVSEEKLTNHTVGKTSEITTHQIDADGSIGPGGPKAFHYAAIGKPSGDLLPEGWLRCSIHLYTQTHPQAAQDGMQYDFLTLPFSYIDIREMPDSVSAFNPYWNATVDRDVMNHHSEFMNQNLARFIWQILFSPQSINHDDAKKCTEEGSATATAPNLGI